MVVKTYDEYQKTELPWLTKVPSHWTWLRNKNIYAEKKEIVGDRKTEFKLLSLTKKGIIIRDVSSGKGKFPKDFDTYKVVNPGDMVFCLFDVDETPRTVGLSNYRGMITGAYDVFGIHGINSKYAYYYYLAFDNLKAYKPLYSGLRKTIPLPSFMATKIPVPPKKEQDQIVHYLDWKIAEIDRFVHQQRKQIRELEELRQKMICQYTHNGIHPNVKKHKSEYPWIDGVPEGWSETRLKYVLTKLNHIRRPQDELLICSNKGKVFFRGDSKMGLIAEDDKIYQGVRTGDLLIHGMDTWHGAIAISEYDGMCTGVVHVCDTHENKRFIMYYLQSLAFKKVYKKITNGVRENTSDFRSWDKAGQINLLLPPRKEQDEIVELLDKKCNEIEQLISATEKEITLLEELRTKIIADVVTGQIDVRNVVIPEYSRDEDTDADDIEDDEEESED